STTNTALTWIVPHRCNRYGAKKSASSSVQRKKNSSPSWNRNSKAPRKSLRTNTCIRTVRKPSANSKQQSGSLPSFPFESANSHVKNAPGTRCPTNATGPRDELCVGDGLLALRGLTERQHESVGPVEEGGTVDHVDDIGVFKPSVT